MSIKGKPLASKSPKHVRISVNKLAEYLDANPTRRKAIVKEAKYPPLGFIAPRYKEVREVIKSYLSGKLDETGVLKEIKKFQKQAVAAAKIPDNEFQVQDNQLSADALSMLLDTDVPEIEGTTITPYEGDNKKMIIKGVTVSVNPDLVVRKEKEKGKGTLLGLIKTHIIKTFPLSDESQKIVAAILFEYAGKYIVNASKGEIVSHKLCIALDVFKQQYVVCPTAIKQRMNRVEDACEEIALWWDKL